SADLHNRFVTGNSEGRITAAKAVVWAFLASHGILRSGSITERVSRRARAGARRAHPRPRSGPPPRLHGARARGGEGGDDADSDHAPHRGNRSRDLARRPVA